MSELRRSSGISSSWETDSDNEGRAEGSLGSGQHSKGSDGSGFSERESSNLMAESSRSYPRPVTQRTTRRRQVKQQLQPSRNQDFHQTSENIALLVSMEKKKGERKQWENNRERRSRHRRHLIDAGSSLAIIAALIGGGVLEVLLSPAWAQVPAEDAGGACRLQGNCGMWRSVFLITASEKYTDFIELASVPDSEKKEGLRWIKPFLYYFRWLLGYLKQGKEGEILKGTSVIHYVSLKNSWFYRFLHYSLLDIILASGEDPENETKDGTTPLMLAAASNNTHVVKVLLTEGADPNRKNKAGWNAVLLACQFDPLYEETVHVLLDAGGDITAMSPLRPGPGVLNFAVFVAIGSF